MTDLLINIGAIVLFVTIVLLIVLKLRLNLLKLWREVSQKEILFYRKFQKTILLFNEHIDQFKSICDKQMLRKLRLHNHKKIRYMILRQRQDLYSVLAVAMDEIEDETLDNFKELKQSYKELQIARRLFNSKVLKYNQTISVFPTRYLALKLGLNLKEYFG
ncbi:MAG: LemA family protein [Candidatus Izimaplasma sp.]|nr:LemA family protein [Candidatus Izimaplasma bacterium]